VQSGEARECAATGTEGCGLSGVEQRGWTRGRVWPPRMRVW